ncbi:hypothetical protein GCM10022384_42730 [Streptomyces marokkonensis]|uniref:Uncharacterized protein n=1 Tax=Streptomyces marokkonensis TaxID=324855 RepID=A0ABP7QZ07_9ACTN
MTGTDDGGPAGRAETEADMGAQHGGDDSGGGHAGTRPAHHDTPGMERSLAAVLREEHVDAEGQRRAVAAFRAAVDAAPDRAARTRRRDDWRPRERAGTGRTLKTALSVLLASLTLGGVAYAAIGAGGSAQDAAGPDRTRPPAATSGTEVRPITTPRPAAPASGAPARPDRPATARDTGGGCRAHERLEGRGKALDAPAWQRLVAAAGDEENVGSYCARRQAPQSPPSAPNTPDDPDGPSGAAEPAAPGRVNGNAAGAVNGNGNSNRDGSGSGSGDVNGNADAERTDRAGEDK